jgi:hypothetical protein
VKLKPLALPLAALLLPACLTEEEEDITHAAPIGLAYTTPKHGLIYYSATPDESLGLSIDSAADWWLDWRVNSFGDGRSDMLAVLKSCTIQVYQGWDVPGDGARAYFGYWWPDNFIEVATLAADDDATMGLRHVGIEWLRHEWTHAKTRRGDHALFPYP